MIIKDIEQEHDLIRKELWIKVAVAYVSASNSASKEGAAEWANQVLKDFDKVFSPAKN